MPKKIIKPNKAPVAKRPVKTVPVKPKKPTSRDSIEWFRGMLTAVRSRNAKQMAEKGLSHFNQQRHPILGTLFFFVYDAKLKDVLPVWDAFPLIFPIAIDDDSMLGLNVHYLPPILRAKIMNALIALNASRITRQKKIKLTYDMLSEIRELAPLQNCIRRYLWNHVRSQFVVVEPSKWELVSSLPMAQWKNGSSRDAYKIGRR